MKIQLKHIPTIEEITVAIMFEKQTNELRRLVRYIESYDYYLICEEDDEQIKVSLKDIFYIEVLERKTFVYCQGYVYECKEKLTELENKLHRYGYYRISRICLLNLEILVSMKLLVNSRLEATLRNNEKVIISRKYIQDIKAYFQTKKEGYYEK